GSTPLAGLQAAVAEPHADLGLAFDGDGDRVMMVDHTGAVVDGDELLFLIARDLQESGRLQGGVVGTLMSNLGLELALQALHI
ncbi:phosphoglucosamine mutase, partial [Pseudomonas aeruginosa]